MDIERILGRTLVRTFGEVIEHFQVNKAYCLFPGYPVLECTHCIWVEKGKPEALKEDVRIPISDFVKMLQSFSITII